MRWILIYWMSVRNTCRFVDFFLHLFVRSTIFLSIHVACSLTSGCWSKSKVKENKNKLINEELAFQSNMLDLCYLQRSYMANDCSLNKDWHIYTCLLSMPSIVALLLSFNEVSFLNSFTDMQDTLNGWENEWVFFSVIRHLTQPSQFCLIVVAVDRNKKTEA